MVDFDLYHAMQSKDGRKILEFCVGYMIDSSNSNMNAEHIKGIGLLLSELKDVEQKFNKEQQKKDK